MNIEFIIIIILLLLIIKNIDIKEFFENNLKKVCSENNGSCFKINTKFNPETFVQAANMLDKINDKNIKFFNFLKKKYLNSWSNKKKRQMVLNLIKRYNPNSIIEHAPINEKNTSYVFAKGKRIGFCLREKLTGNNNIQDFSTIYFVNLHELSHLAATEYNPNHDERFWADFKFILKEAVEAGVYTPIDYSIKPKHYCGIDIFYNPLYDNKIKSI